MIYSPLPKIVLELTEQLSLNGKKINKILPDSKRYAINNAIMRSTLLHSLWQALQPIIKALQPITALLLSAAMLAFLGSESAYGHTALVYAIQGCAMSICFIHNSANTLQLFILNSKQNW